MSNRLFVFTASGPEAERHYIDTIEEGFSLEKMRPLLLEKEFETIKNIFGERKIRAWGATPGSGNRRTWNNLDVGDRILIYRKGNYEYVAIIVYKFHNKELAENLWGTDSKEQTWEFMYLLDNLTELSIPYSELNKVLGYADNYFPQGFAQIKDERLQPVVSKFGSVDEFLNYLAEGRWVKVKEDISEEMKKQIIKERVARQIGRSELLEQNLENFIVNQLDKIEPGLKLIDRQKDLGEVGRLDLLCQNHNYNYVVIEIKKWKAGSSVIDQTARYMGWVKRNMTKPGQTVRGIIIVGKEDTYLRYEAAALNQIIDIKTFDILPRSILEESDPKVQLEIWKTILRNLSDSIAEELIPKCNEKFAFKNNGQLLFKITNEFLRGLKILKEPIKNREDFGSFIDVLYKMIIESSGNLDRIPNDFKTKEFIGTEINKLRNYFRHDTEHGDDEDVRLKKEKISKILEKYTSKKSFESLEEDSFFQFQENLLRKISSFLKDLENIL